MPKFTTNIRRVAKNIVPNQIIEAVQAAIFQTKRSFTSYDIPDMPRFDDDSTAFFIEQLHNSNFYVEYGTGGSTVQAANMGKAFIAVDSDRGFLSSVQKKLRNLRNDQRLIHIDIGLTGPWGRPIFKKLTGVRLKRWNKYPEAPWKLITDERLPDLILIDGRFRVACALTTIKYMCNHSKSRLLVDDYAERPHYHIIERYARLDAMIGRMAVFCMMPFDEKDLEHDLEKYNSDWR